MTCMFNTSTCVPDLHLDFVIKFWILHLFCKVIALDLHIGSTITSAALETLPCVNKSYGYKFRRASLTDYSLSSSEVFL